jgi:DNA replication protein DnaC
MVQNRKDNNNIVAFPARKNDRFSYYLEKLQARREAGLSLFTEADKNEPDWIIPYDPPKYTVYEKCGHVLDGAVKYTRGELAYSPETVGGQPGYKSTITPCPHCTETQRHIHGERVMKSRLSSESNLPQYTQNSTWDTLPEGMDSNARDDIKKDTFASINAIRNGGKGKNQFIHGGTGGGKTTFVVLASREFMKAGIGVYYIFIRDYLQTLKQEASRRYDTHTEHEESIERVALNAPVLVIDDLGAEDGTRWEIGKIFDLIETRLAKGLTTLITSNNSPAVLRNKWKSVVTDPEAQDQGGRIVERLKTHYVTTEVLKI